MTKQTAGQPVTPPVTIGIVVVALIVLGYFGWRYFRSTEVPPPDQRTGGLTKDQFLKDMQKAGASGSSFGNTPLPGSTEKTSASPR